MNKSNALNVFTTIPTTTRNTSLELQVFTTNVLDKHIQCDLLKPPLNCELRSFSIQHKQKRKRLVQYIFGWIILQNFIYLPIMYLCLQYETIIQDEDYWKEFLEFLLAVDLILSAVFYYFRSFRRRMPHLCLIMVTILSALLCGMFANFMDSKMVLMQPTILILQLVAMILFSWQTKFSFTYFTALLIVCSIFSSVILLDIFVFKTHSGELYMACMFGSLITTYVTLDVQLMMTSPLHKYCMAANEHVFGAVNVFADQVKLAWIIFYNFFLDGPLSIVSIVFKTLNSKFY